MSLSLINDNAWLPAYSHHPEHIYILLTSLNLGGAEKIVSDQLWANHYSKSSKKITLIVIYEKQKEHALPPETNVIRLHNNIQNGEILFKQIAYEQKPLVCHLINDKIAHYLFDLNLHLHFVVHNDKRGWANSIEVFNHNKTISIVAVAKFVKEQLKEAGVIKPIYNFRHHIKDHTFAFNKKMRDTKRAELGISDDEIVIGMIGRICQQKNYYFALDIIANLIKSNPKYKLIILGGFEPQFLPLYTELLQKINTLKLHKHVLLPGFKTDPHNWMNTFDIGLNTSYFEGLSMATQEFMRNGLPMVLSEVCGQPEIIDSLSQLHFFTLPTILDTPETSKYSINSNYSDFPIEKAEQLSAYLKQINKVTDIIISLPSLERLEFNDDDKKLSSFFCYGSHNNWNLLNHIYPPTENKTIIPAFITSNLNAGGAQASLINLLKKFKEHDTKIPLILLNQSNQEQYFNQLTKYKLDYYLCHQSIDVFDICTNLFTYFHSHNINRIILWNVDAKMKLLISKFFGHSIDIIDVSPGDYILEEMEKETIFQEAIYYNQEEYFSSIYRFISKYNNSSQNVEYKQWLSFPTQIIPNGVPQEDYPLAHKKTNDSFHLLICGRISPSKHLETIFSGWNKFTQEYPDRDFRCDVYGSVEPCYLDYYNNLKIQFEHLFNKGTIVWKGHHHNPKEVMSQYHAIVVLGTHQGCPNVVLEAATCHLPVIANNSGGTSEIINFETGTLLPEEISEEHLLLALQKFYNDYETHWNKSETCLQHIKDNFSMQQMMTSYEKIIYDK